MIPASYVLACSLLATSASGQLAGRSIPQAGAEEIAGYCSEHPIRYYAVVPGDELCACLLPLHTFRESGWDLHAVGDGGRARGPFQVWGRAPHDWHEAMSVFGTLLRRASVCETPLEMLAQGKCGEGAGRTIALARLAEAKRMVLAMRFAPAP